LRSIEFAGIAEARAAPGVIETIEQSDGIVITPSNPLISIGPILAVPGVRAALGRRRERVVAVCPLVGGKSLKGPSDRMMAQLGYDVSAVGVARLYQDVCSAMVIDDADGSQSSALKALDIRPVIAPTVMRTLQDKEQLAQVVLRLFESKRA
jgi:LPPG:FO 2-phospho-L-lactate transferase